MRFDLCDGTDFSNHVLRAVSTYAVGTPADSFRWKVVGKAFDRNFRCLPCVWIRWTTFVLRGWRNAVGFPVVCERSLKSIVWMAKRDIRERWQEANRELDELRRARRRNGAKIHARETLQRDLRKVKRAFDVVMACKRSPFRRSRIVWQQHQQLLGHVLYPPSGMTATRSV